MQDLGIPFRRRYDEAVTALDKARGRLVGIEQAALTLCLCFEMIVSRIRWLLSNVPGAILRTDGVDELLACAESKGLITHAGRCDLDEARRLRNNVIHRYGEQPTWAIAFDSPEAQNRREVVELVEDNVEVLRACIRNHGPRLFEKAEVMDV
ncbi:MAG: hypothetical protein AB7I45_01415 [Planctomycetota bacterium]